MINTIILIVSTLIFGALVGFLVGRIIFKRQKQKIIDNVAEKIMKQDKDFILDGKKHDLKDEIRRAEKGLPPIKEVEKKEGKKIVKKAKPKKVVKKKRTKKLTIPVKLKFQAKK